MTCIKTGAKVYFANYGMVVPADLHKVDNCTIIRWNNAAPFYTRDAKEGHATHIVGHIVDSAMWWHREDLGVTVVPSSMIYEF